MRPIEFTGATCPTEGGYTAGFAVLFHDKKERRVRIVNGDTFDGPLPGSAVVPDTPEALRELATALTEMADYQDRARMAQYEPLGDLGHADDESCPKCGNTHPTRDCI